VNAGVIFMETVTVYRFVYIVLLPMPT